jgi:quercetin dioxygenase-like cupin family protein
VSFDLARLRAGPREGNRVQVRNLLFALLWILPLPLVAQAPSAVLLDEEPHHHLSFENGFVKVHEVALPPHDAYKLHRHVVDEIAVTIAGGTAVVVTPDKPDVLQIYKDGDVRFVRAGRVHSTRNIGETTIRNVSIGLLRPQGDARNLCAAILPDQPLHCPALPAAEAASRNDQPLFETEQMRATLSRVHPQQSATFGESDRDELVIAIDPFVLADSVKMGPGRIMNAGDFLWLERKDATRALKNDRSEDARFVTFSFLP